MNLTRRLLLSVFAALFLLSAGAQAQPLPIDRQVTTGRLDNGMRFFFRSTESTGVDIRLVVNTGSLDERDDELGYAHFVEHLAFRKTKRFRDGEIVDFVRSLGGNFGQHLNAFTSHNQTQYWISLPSGKVDALPKAVQIIRDWASNIEFSDDIIQIERGVVAAEKRGRDQSTQPIFKIRQTMYDQGLYRREIVGTYETIAKANATNLAAFYKRTYTPERMSIVISGQLPDGANFWLRKLNDEFGPKAAVDTTPPIRPAFTFENRVRVLQLTDGQRSSIGLVSLFPQVIGSRREDFTAWLTRTVATGVLNQRLRETAKLQNWTLDQAASDFPLTNDARGFEVSIVVNDRAKFLDGYALLREVLEKFLREGPTAQELDSVTRPLLRAARTFEEESVKQTPPAVSSTLALFAHSGGYYISAARYRELLEEELPRITPDATVKSIGLRYEKQDLLLIVQGQRNDPIPKLNEQELITISKEFSVTLVQASANTTAKSEALRESKIVERVMPPPLAAGGITREEELPNDIIRLTLSNNAIVYVKPNKTATVDQVVFSAKRVKGAWSINQEQLAAVRLAQAGAWLTDGIGPYDQTSFARELTAKNMNFRIAMGNTDVGIGFRGRSEDLPFSLHLFHQFIREPKFDQTNYDRLSTRVRPIMTGQNPTPEQQFQQEWRQARYGKSPWLDPLSDKDFDAVTLTQLKRLHTEVFGDASQFVFAFTGNISMRDIRHLCETYIANLPSSKSSEMTQPEWASIPLEKTGVRTEFRAGKADRVNVSIRYINQSIQDTLELGGTGSQMQSVLSNRLRIALRQETGLTYSPSSSVQVFAKPLNGIYISVDVTVAPADVAKVEAAIKATVESIAQLAPNTEELNAFREAYGAANRNLFADPNSVAELLLTLHIRKVPIQELLRVRQNVLQRDAASIAANFKNILNGIEPSVGIHRPEDK
jgi:zinc protease